MHPKIKGFYTTVVKKFPKLDTYDLVLNEMLEIGCSRTEAWVVLHKGYGVDKEKADQIVLESNLWEDEDYLDTMYQVAQYLKDDFEKGVI